MFLSPKVFEETIASSVDSFPTISSPTENWIVFKYTYSNLSVFTFLTMIATAPEFCPSIYSPTTKFWLIFGFPEISKVGNAGSNVLLDSYTARTLTASGIFKLIILSWTLVP